jgi:hypothetical protein
VSLAPAPHEVLFAELLWVHDHLRAGLAAVADLAERTAAGQDARQVSDEVAGLARDSALWRLRAHCLYQCRFVHGHHSLEDAVVFPAVRDTDPSIGAEVDRLQADHVAIAGLLHAVQDAADGLGDGLPGARRRLLAALDRLQTDLNDHLGREETLLRPVLARMGSWAG